VRWYCEEAYSPSFFLIGVVLRGGPKVTLEVQVLCLYSGCLCGSSPLRFYPWVGACPCGWWCCVSHQSYIGHLYCRRLLCVALYWQTSQSEHYVTVLGM